MRLLVVLLGRLAELPLRLLGLLLILGLLIALLGRCHLVVIPLLLAGFSSDQGEFSDYDVRRVSDYSVLFILTVGKFALDIELVASINILGNYFGLSSESCQPVPGG